MPTVLSLAGFRGSSTLEKALYMNDNYHFQVPCHESRASHSITTILQGKTTDEETKAETCYLLEVISLL